MKSYIKPTTAESNSRIRTSILAGSNKVINMSNVESNKGSGNTTAEARKRSNFTFE